MKLSIITVSLNDKAGLQQSIESVISQKFRDFEFIVIDGKSSDGSEDIIKKYADHIDYWVSEPDKGIYDAMNKGIGIAKGEYCFFLNAGDRLSSDDILLKVFEDDPHESFISLDFAVMKEEVENIQLYKDRSWDLALYDIYAGFLCHQAFLIRRDNFAKYGLYDDSLKIISDWKLFLTAIGVYHEPVIYKNVSLCTVRAGGVSELADANLILEEKTKVVKEILSLPTLQRLNKLYHYESNGYMVDIILSKKWIHNGFRLFCKIGRACGFLKTAKIERK